MSQDHCSVCHRLDSLRDTACYGCREKQCTHHSVIIRQSMDGREVSVLRGFYCLDCMAWTDTEGDFFAYVGDLECDIGNAIPCPSCKKSTQLYDEHGRLYCARCDKHHENKN